MGVKDPGRGFSGLVVNVSKDYKNDSASRGTAVRAIEVVPYFGETS